jgi:hypothetical protein
MPDAQARRLRFVPGVGERLAYYVYLLIDPRTGRPFYVGKGVGDRCFAHLDEARRTLADAKGDYAKLATIREIEGAGEEVGIDILRHGMTEESAFAVEAAAIDLLGMSDLSNRVAGSGTSQVGRMTVADLTAAYGARPVVISPDEPVLLIRVSRVVQRGMTDADLYEATRAWWKVGIHRARACQVGVLGLRGRRARRLPHRRLGGADAGTRDRGPETAGAVGVHRPARLRHGGALPLRQRHRLPPARRPEPGALRQLLALALDAQTKSISRGGALRLVRR